MGTLWENPMVRCILYVVLPQGTSYKLPILRGIVYMGIWVWVSILVLVQSCDPRFRVPEVVLLFVCRTCLCIGGTRLVPFPRLFWVSPCLIYFVPGRAT